MARSDIQLTGRLDRDAEPRRTRDGQHLLFVRLAVPAAPGGTPIVARLVQDFGTGPAAGVACSNRAHHLRRGVRLQVRAAAMTGLRGVAVLHDVEFLHAPDLINHRPGTND